MGPATRWLLNPETTAGAVQSLDNYDISGDGVKDLIVGRHDGNIEVYSYDDGDETEPLLKYTHVSIDAFSHVSYSILHFLLVPRPIQKMTAEYTSFNNFNIVTYEFR